MLDFWMRRGVDGLRLDAVPYLYEREGTSCENLPETHMFLKELRRYIDARYRNRMLLAEANQWPEDAAAYFGNGDECHMNFHFPIMPRMFMAIRMEDRYPIVDILQQTPPIPENCQWATFLRNHDELTLEMVTDRERDYMYQAYARDREMRLNLGIRRRLAPLLNNDRRAIELMNALLFSMPGSPVIYYGDEIGMGDNVYLGDRNGVRTPMQWSTDRNAGFSRANPQRLYLPLIIDPQFHYESINVEAQETNPQSLLWWMRRLIGLRKRFTAFGRGSLEFLSSSNHKVLSFLRTWEGQQVLVVANLSRFAQQVELELRRFQGMVPVEAFGQTRFRPVGNEPYYLTLGPYTFYWFSLEPQQAEILSSEASAAPLEITVNGNWENALEGRARAILERGLQAYLTRHPRSLGRDRKIESARTIDTIRIAQRGRVAHLLVVQIEYADGSLEMHALPLAFADGEAAQVVQLRFPQTMVARVRFAGKEEGLLYDALWDEQFAALLLQTIIRKRRSAGKQMEIVPASRDELQQILPAPEEENLTATTLRAEQRRVATVFADKLLLKTYRKLEPAINPDLEVGRFLTDRGFAHAPATVGSLQILRPGYEPMTLAILRQFVPHEGTAWQYTLHALGQYFEGSLAKKGESLHQLPLPCEDLLSCVTKEIPAVVPEIVGFYLAQAALLGERTAEFHRAMAAEAEDPAFAPEPYTSFYQQSQYQALHYLQARTFQALENRLAELSEEARGEARAVLDAAGEIRRRFLTLRDRKFESLRIRCHGNYHLGQVLYTGKDFMITDFEGDPGQSLSERRAKRSVLRDVAGMLRSFHQAAYAAMLADAEGTLPAGLKELEPWYRFWQAWVPVSFLRGYLDAAGKAPFVPGHEEETRALLDVCLLEEMLTELRFELEHRPTWVRVPLQGILQLLRPAGQSAVSL